jgi:hypothetical protein
MQPEAEIAGYGARVSSSLTSRFTDASLWLLSDGEWRAFDVLTQPNRTTRVVRDVRGSICVAATMLSLE